MRSLILFALGLSVSAPATGQVKTASRPAPAHVAALLLAHGVVSDTTGAIIPGAEVDLIDPSGAIVSKVQSGGDGSFSLTAPHPGKYTLIVSEPGFKTAQLAISITSASARPAATIHVAMPIAAVATNVHVSADSNSDLTDTADNSDASVMTASDLKALPIFDNDFVGAMGAFLDADSEASGGSGLLVDGMEANRVTVSPSAVQEVLINQDPYSARYYFPGRGQIEIITKAAAQQFHGELNFYFRDSAMNAQNALAPSKPFEQRRIYEGSASGPIPHAHNSSFLVSFNRAEEDMNAVINATLAPTQADPTGVYQANVATPTRDTEFSIRTGHQFGQMTQAYLQYSYQNWSGQNQGVGGQTLAPAGYNHTYHEDDLTARLSSALSANLLNQLALVGERTNSRNRNVTEGPRISLAGDYVSGSAQADSLGTEYNFRLFDHVTLSHGKHLIRFGVGIPHLGRRAYDDHTNELGSYTFAPTVASNGTVEQTTFQNYASNKPSSFTQNTGDTHFVYLQQEMGAYIQDQYKINDRLAITPGLRYDWENFLSGRRLGFSPRFSFAWVLDQHSKTILRGGGGVYYDRFGGGPLLDLARYQTARRRSVQVELNPALEPVTGCVPITNCTVITAQPPRLVQLQPHAALPYRIDYGLSIERQLGERATGTISIYSMRGIHMFRSLDVNAPTAASGYTQRPNPAYGRIRQMQPESYLTGNGFDISYRGRWNKHFTGFGRYTWSHYATNTGGIGWFPEDQTNPGAEWANSSWDRAQRFSMYAIFNPDSLYNLAAGIFANTGSPWTELTGTDLYGDGLFNTRPAGVARNSRVGPGSVDLDLRWRHDFAITKNKADDAPHLGFSVGAFNALNHVNGGGINPVITSPTYGKFTSAGAPRRIQLSMRYQF